MSFLRGNLERMNVAFLSSLIVDNRHISTTIDSINKLQHESLRDSN
jgi:hypothetical protein